MSVGSLAGLGDDHAIGHLPFWGMDAAGEAGCKKRGGVGGEGLLH